MSAGRGKAPDSCSGAETVSPKSPAMWEAAIAALATYSQGYNALARKIGGRQSVEPLTTEEWWQLNDALAPFRDLALVVRERCVGESATPHRAPPAPSSRP